MRIIFFSHTAPSGVFRVGSHHLSRELAALGHDVAHISTPLSAVHTLRSAWSQKDGARTRFAKRPTRDGDGVVQYVPRILLPASKTPFRINNAQMKLAARVVASRLSDFVGADVAFVDQPLMQSMAEAFDVRTLVYRPTDAHHDPRSRAAEIRLLAQSDGVAATSLPTLMAVTQHQPGRWPATVIENGVDYERFEATAPSSSRDGFVYLGALDERFDWDVIRALARSFPAERFTLAGPIRVTPKGLPANIRLVGGVSYNDAPRLLAEHSVGLLPLSDHPGNVSRSPMKYFEYLAAGLSVLSRRTQGVEYRQTPNVWMYDTVDEAIRSARSALGTSDGDRSEGRIAAGQKSWKSRATALMSFALATRDGSAAQ